MKKFLYVIPALFLSFTSCDNANDPTETVKNEIIVKVYDVSTWSVSTNKLDTTIGATVRLISDSTTFMSTTGKDGTVTFSNVTEGDYTIIANKENKCNLIKTASVDNKTIGYLVAGVYSSQAEIENSPTDSSAVVGGPRLYDLNGDAIINNNDKTGGQFCSFKYKYQDMNADGVIDVYDLINGNLVRVDNQIIINVYIANNN